MWWWIMLCDGCVCYLLGFKCDSCDCCERACIVMLNLGSLGNLSKANQIHSLILCEDTPRSSILT
jgi:hypothetical protein